jgi:MFS family permease
MFSGVAVALPGMGTDLGAGATSLGLVETLFLAGSVAFLLPIGRLADAGGKATLYKLGLLSFGVSSLAVAFFSSIPVILFLRFLQGVTSSATAATAPAIVADLVPPERRGAA